ncbi:MAG: DUF763 domain-containing protein [Candidatus Hadarchaeum sp.]|uniref:DUF763 domain-containing protein n=1 Tax=Candidatus Hadarchaeum sp. TaxID=2883567 RepID=UPI003D0A6FC0
MKRTGTAELPLHYGACPPWLFRRMVRLSGAIAEAIVLEYGTEEFLRRMADPFFFQSLGCVVGFDFHSSGLTTTLTGALREALNPEELGMAVCGGKGRVSKSVPQEIQRLVDVFSFSTAKAERLKYASRMAAKVDNACVQDGYQLYHHAFIVDEHGNWAVVQQGMNQSFARRYHWLSEKVASFVEEPHAGIIGDRGENTVLDMTARESEESRKISVDLVCEGPKKILAEVREAGQRSLDEFTGRRSEYKLIMPRGHTITSLSKQTMMALRRAYEIQPQNYEELVSLSGIGPKAVRALALVSALIYGKPPSWRDPVRYSFAHGGKDGVPFPVDRQTYQRTTEILEGAIEAARFGSEEKMKAIRRLHEFVG